MERGFPSSPLIVGLFITALRVHTFGRGRGGVTIGTQRLPWQHDLYVTFLASGRIGGADNPVSRNTRESAADGAALQAILMGEAEAFSFLRRVNVLSA